MTGESDSDRMNSDDSTIGDGSVPGECPPADVLRRLSLGQFDAAELNILEPHLSRCEVCAQRLEEIRKPDPPAGGLTGTGESVARPSSVTPKPGEWPTRFRELLTELRLASTRAQAESQGGAAVPIMQFAANSMQLRDGPDGKLKPGTRLGVYEIVRCLGAGGIGEVYLARQIRLDRHVALKVLTPKLTNDSESLQRFEREMRAIARLDHPNVVHAYDANESDGIHFLVMEYVDGQDLHALVRQHGPLQPDQAVDYVIQAAQGLAAAHAQNIVHRDIKPSNLLLDQNGQVKVLDLGLARLDVGVSNNSPSELTTSGVIMGTVDYMAPEQGNDSRRVDGRSDVYSLGCTLFFLLTGRSPYTGDGLLDRVVAHRLNEIPNIQTFCPAASDSLAKLLNRCLAKTPIDRYQSMPELIAALKECVPAGTSNQIMYCQTDNSVPLHKPEMSAAQQTLADTEKTEAGLTQATEKSNRLNRISGNIIAVGAAALIILLAVVVLRDDGARKHAPTDAPETATLAKTSSKEQPPPDIPSGATSQIVDGDWGVLSIKHPDLLEFLTTTGKLTPEGMKALAGFPKLQHLEWNGPATDESLAYLADLTDLQVLSLAAGPDFHGSGLRHLRKCRQLNFLRLSGTGMDDDGLLSLPDLPLLGKLGINHTKVGDRGLVALERCPELEQIAVHYCPAITDAGLSHFAVLTKLAALNLEACPQVTDAGLEQLSKIKSLVWVDLRGTGVTNAGVQQLKEWLPMCKVIFESSE